MLEKYITHIMKKTKTSILQQKWAHHNTLTLAVHL